MNPLNVLAGSLNEYELEIIEIARGKFEVDGVTYEVTGANIEALIKYLDSDDVDITKEQKEELVNTMNNSMQRGIAEGYLVPVDDIVEGESSNVDNSAVETEESDTPINQEIEYNDSSIEEESMKDSIEDKEVVVIVDNDKGIVRVTDENETDILIVNTVIKNTGFNLYSTVMIAVGLGVIMLGCFIVTMKYQLFAWHDE